MVLWNKLFVEKEMLMGVTLMFIHEQGEVTALYLWRSVFQKWW